VLGVSVVYLRVRCIGRLFALGVSVVYLCVRCICRLFAR